MLHLSSSARWNCTHVILLRNITYMLYAQAVVLFKVALYFIIAGARLASLMSSMPLTHTASARRTAQYMSLRIQFHPGSCMCRGCGHIINDPLSKEWATAFACHTPQNFKKFLATNDPFPRPCSGRYGGALASHSSRLAPRH